MVAEEDRLFDYSEFEAATGEDQASQHYDGGSIGGHYMENQFNGDGQEPRSAATPTEDDSQFSEVSHGGIISYFLCK